MKQSENITELLSALAEIQNELPTMPKSSQAYGYKYTDLDTITQTIKPILHRHGVAYMQSVGGVKADGGEAATLTTRIFNTKGEYIEDTAFLPEITGTKNNSAQTLGMSITYMRRYMLCAMLGITSDEDVDANAQRTGNGELPPQVETVKKMFGGEVVKRQPALAFEPKGGETTPAERKEIASLLSSKNANGAPIFAKDEMKHYSDERKDYTAAEVIGHIKAELQKRLSPPKAEPAQQSFGGMQPAEQSQQGFEIY